ncbi:TraB/GumN family protein [Variovorax sp. ZS18.2.2]|uniref:TraB/GumN family protein n=1 Tax=Variovorax sp. ZS18.2.2 TaxID=2971255 RepID=UPI002150C93F|nr:TraB/GumN family protein [Variovorax sp. ZS18.2.2]MCR6475913.1 TraB/GumN family protein [Variovorax sp. ZS18.2.2]
MLVCGLGLVVVSGCKQDEQISSAKADCPPSAASLVPKGGWASAPPQTEDHGFLWRIEKDDQTSWLYGTAHIARPEWMRPGPKVREALQQSDVIALEINMETDPSAQKALAGYSTNKAGADLFSKAQRERLARLVATSCLPAGIKAQTDQMSLFRQMLLLGLVQRQADGLYLEFGVDGYLAGHARQTGMPLVGLEAAADQLNAMGSDRSKTLAERIDEMLGKIEADKGRTLVVTTTTAWARGDLDKLEHYADWCDCLNTPEDRSRYERMTAGRNAGMARNIERLHAEGKRVFAAVGAMHMVGSKGLPALLAERGFQVTRIPFAEHP